ncbi:MAG: TonB-dependent receptor family protein [Bacteroidia bacterium]|nr:TonB-dependent receptor family protein [Bacteroidia bacterium]
MSYSKVLSISTIIVLLAINTLFGQRIEIIGQVVNGNQPIEFATVVAVDTLSQKTVGGTTTDMEGRFTLKAPSQDILIQVSFLGYETLNIHRAVGENNRLDLGQIQLKESGMTMEEVVISGEKSQMEFKLDKRVFNVGKDLSSTGASALEVLNNVPSVNVSIEGDISLRGSQGVQILINGKPSVLASEQGNALGSITADMIEKIEVITNPSAKYDAEGTSGILNIVLKKEEKKGINGSFTINTGFPQNHSFGLSMNRRTEKFNLFTQLGAGYRVQPNQVDNINENLITGTRLISDGEEFRNENFYNFVLGTDYHINKYNVITLSGNFAYEIEDQPSETNFQLFDEEDVLISQWKREETTSATNPKYRYELQYKKDFKDHKEHDLLFSALGNFFGKDQSSEFLNTSIIGDGESGEQQTRTNFQEARYTFKLDYTKPFKKYWSIETGAQYVINNVSNDFAVSNFLSGEWIQDDGLTNIFEFSQNVLGLYGTGAYEGEKWGLKLGLRAENTDLNTFLVNTSESNTRNFTNLFPSAHTSYKFTKRVSIQAGYSRRIYRPRLWDLNPFFNIRNNFSIRTGNPDLLPEFTDSYELTSIFILNQASINAGVFHRYTTDVIERISSFEDNVTTFKPVNLGTDQSTGIELNGKYEPAKWITFNGDATYLFFNRVGSFDATSFDFTASRWNAKLTAKFKLPASIDAEITGRYESAFQTVQGEVSDQLFANLGLRKKILKGRGIFNLSVRDIFASRIRESNTFQPNFYQYNRRFRGRFIVAGFSYGFGKGEAMEFSGRRRR